MIRLLSTVVILVILSGCSSWSPARYFVSADNIHVLRSYSGAAVKVASITTEGNYAPTCRLMGPIQAADGMSIPQFVEKAFNDELKFAGLYSESGVNLTGVLTKVGFSSGFGITNGTWDLALTLNSSNGMSMDAAISYGFKSDFDAVRACNQTAQALGAAVQDLIKAVVTDARFSSLVQRTSAGL